MGRFGKNDHTVQPNFDGRICDMRNSRKSGLFSLPCSLHSRKLLFFLKSFLQLLNFSILLCPLCPLLGNEKVFPCKLFILLCKLNILLCILCTQLGNLFLQQLDYSSLFAWHWLVCCLKWLILLLLSQTSLFESVKQRYFDSLAIIKIIIILSTIDFL